MTIKDWPHQVRMLQGCREQVKAGKRAWVVQAACGAGKSRVMTNIIVPVAASGKRVALYSPRRALTKQLIDQLTGMGVGFGVVASGFPAELNRPNELIQICSLQTVAARMNKSRFVFPHAEYVIVDEAHQQVGKMADQVFAVYTATNSKRIGFTATPVNLADDYESLVCEATYRELREVKAHLPVKCFGPDRPDLSCLRTNNNGDFSQNDDEKVNAVAAVIGSVYDNWKKLNPKQLPAIGFATSVEASRGFVYEFAERGVACCHIDADRCLFARHVGGEVVVEEELTSEGTRAEILRGSKAGDYKIIWNRFILREAVDCPWLYHCITATSMGGLSTYLQSVGRVLRYCSDYDEVIYQDHGGCIDRHGLPNEERNWELGDTNKSLHKKEKERRTKTKGDEAEPICCPKCNSYRTHGPKCPNCGHMHKRSSRLMREADGTLVRKSGRMVKYKPEKTFDDYYRSAIYGGHHAGMSVAQAYNIARHRARKAGVRVFKEDLYVPPDGSREWKQSVKSLFPHMKPNGKRKRK